MRYIATGFLAMGFFFCSFSAGAQYILNGNATQNSCNCYTLTQPLNNLYGSVWNANKINLNSSFDFVFNVYLGCLDANGADGIVFILQPLSTSIGSSGGGMGFQGISPSVGIALDTWQNIENNDPAYDHISIQVNGNINHLNDIAPLVPASPVSDNIEDCQWHTFRIKWDPVTHVLQTYFDGTFRQQATIDMVATIFSNDPMVYWGFSGATGGAINLQQFCTALNPGFVSATANTISCDSSAVTFSSTSQSFAPVASYYWDFGDGTTSIVANPPVHHYSAPNSYNIKLVISGLDGCVSDTLRRTINLPGQLVTAIVTNPIICQGLNYTLPWGTIVNTTGIYRDTLHYTTGCDSVRRTVNLTVQSSSTLIVNTIICEGETYTLPWGTIVNSTGIYRDTLHYASGCDSIRRTVNLTVQSSASQAWTATICEGSSYTLPWGIVVNSTGIYRDTLHYASGCDSIRRTVDLTVQPLVSATLNPIICTGTTYTLPWGLVVNTPGVYRDTLRYVSGCDSIRRTVNLTVQTFTSSSLSALICGGQTYTLPWGTIVNSTGIYRDTLRYASGCDSIRRTVDLTVQSPAIITFNPAICPGGSYTLPWGVTVNMAGIYSDTSRYTTGCDSVIRKVTLRVTAAALYSLNIAICADETYTLPWGTVTNTTGIYQDTVRTAMGCDSLVRMVNLTVNPVPSVAVSKSNDVDCMLGIAKLEASGGVKYSWTPAASLNNANIYNPVAAPSADTWYHVKITSDKGCTKQDSIEVKVMAGNIQNGYPVPNAFTPDGDGKNDCFGLQAWGFVTDFKLSIYNRWGQMIFYTNRSSGCWDGTYKGAKQNSGMYIYQVSGKGFCGAISRNGTFALIR
jgi:gliding motility-associated-like protein